MKRKQRRFVPAKGQHSTEEFDYFKNSNVPETWVLCHSLMLLAHQVFQKLAYFCTELQHVVESLKLDGMQTLGLIIREV